MFAGDVRDPNGVRTAMKGCDSVLHLAALIGIPYSYHAPDSYVDVNVRGTLNVVQAARDLGVSKVVVTSTSEVYGTAQFVPITEEHPLVGQSPYSATKIGADQIAMSFYRSFETPVAIARPFNTYGPRQSARAVIPTVITQIARRATARIKLGALDADARLQLRRATPSRGMIAIHDSPTSVGEVDQHRQRLRDHVGDTVRADRRGDGQGRRDRMRGGAAAARRRARSSGCGRTTPRRSGCSAGSPSYAGVEGLRRGLEATVDWFSDSGEPARYRTGGYTHLTADERARATESGGCSDWAAWACGILQVLRELGSGNGRRGRPAGAGARQGGRRILACRRRDCSPTRSEMIEQAQPELLIVATTAPSHADLVCLGGGERRARHPVREADGRFARAVRSHDRGLRGIGHAARSQSSDALHGAIHEAEGDRRGRRPLAGLSSVDGGRRQLRHRHERLALFRDVPLS